jgi:chromosome segregation ATPase
VAQVEGLAGKIGALEESLRRSEGERAEAAAQLPRLREQLVDKELKVSQLQQEVRKGAVEEWQWKL